MLVLPIHRILFTIIVFLVFHSTAEETNNAAENSLFGMVPDCAKDCVESFIKSEYTPTECTSPSNVNCLCRTKTPDGLTLGEAALSCVLSVCSKEVIADSKAYHICDSVAGAIPKTHKTITATVFSDMSTTMANPTTTDAVSTGSATVSVGSSEAPLTTTTTSGLSLAASLPTSSSTSSTSSKATSTQTTSSQTSEITFYNSSSSGSNVEPTASTQQDVFPSSGSSEDANKKGDHSISPGAIIGMSVASGVAGCFIVVVAVIFCCKRWRNKHREQSGSYNFEIGGAMSEPPDFSKPMPRLPTSGSGPGSLHDQTMEEQSSQQPRAYPPMATVSNVQSPLRYSPHFATVSYPPSHQRQGSREQERIGFAVSSDSDWETSPRTQSSQHSVARLLPDPTGLYPKPLKWSHRPASGETLFEEDETQQIAAMMRNNPRPGTQPRLAGLAGLPANPRAFKETNPKRGSISRALAPAFSPAFNPASYTPDGPNPTNLLNPSPSLPPKQPSPPMHHPQNTEVISRPRIVRKDDIKRVQIGSSPRSEVVVPYCPDSLWLEHGHTDKPRKASTGLPYPSEVDPGLVGYPDSPKKKGRDENRVSPTSRNLTPSRRGTDLILRVD